MGEQGVVGSFDNYGALKSRFCGRKRAELQGVAGGLDVRFGQEEGKADESGSCTRGNGFD